MNQSTQPTFSDGSLVLDWVTEAQRLRLVPFLERAEHLKAMSFDDLNLFRSRQVRGVSSSEGCGGVMSSPYTDRPTNLNSHERFHSYNGRNRWSGATCWRARGSSRRTRACRSRASRTCRRCVGVDIA